MTHTHLPQADDRVVLVLGAGASRPAPFPLVADVDAALRGARIPVFNGSHFELSDELLPWYGNSPTLSHEAEFVRKGLNNDRILLASGALNEFWKALHLEFGLDLTFESIWDLFDHAATRVGGSSLDPVQFLLEKCQTFVEQHEGYADVARSFRAAAEDPEQADVQRNLFLDPDWEDRPIEEVQRHFRDEADRLDTEAATYRLELLFDDVRNYILYGFDWLLRHFDAQADPTALTLVADFASSPTLRGIITFNQDTLVERLLVGRIHDGFIDEALTHENARAIPTMAAHQGKVGLVKAHGSHNWYPHQSRGIVRTTVGRAHDSMDVGWFHPMILLGKDAKNRDYEKPFWEALQVATQRCLAEATLVVTCGYSFGDAPANLRIADWLSADESRRMLVVLPEGGDAFRNADDITRPVFTSAVASGRIHAPTGARADMTTADLDTMLSR